MMAAPVVTREQMQQLAIGVNTIQGLLKGLVDISRVLHHRYADDPEMASLRSEFAGVLCESNRTKVELELLYALMAAQAAESTRMCDASMRVAANHRERARPPVRIGKMAAAADDSDLELDLMGSDELGREEQSTGEVPRS